MVRAPILVLAAALALGVASAQFQQSPFLDPLVADGTLPPIEQRLPANPLVVVPHERVGTYGGTWTVLGGQSAESINRHIGYENLVRWNEDGSEVVPNLAESWTVEGEGTVYTFVLREGLRWSDGAPFTADDILFWYDDLARNEVFNPGGGLNWYTGGIPSYMLVPVDGVPTSGTVERVDERTVRFVFPAANGLFVQNVASVWGLTFTRYPKHYLSQFHPTYNPDADALASEAGVDSWVQLMKARMEWWDNAALPTMNAWQLERGYADSTTRLEAVRNPYYFKVDTAGNQLPYIDRFAYSVVADSEVQLLQMLDGVADFAYGGAPLVNDNKGLFLDNAERGSYRLIDVVPSQLNTLVVALNLNHQDPVLRSVFQNRDFRAALSHAIDRQEIIDLVHRGQGVPFQTAPRPESIYADEALANQHLEFDLDVANDLLDGAGFAARNADGLRLLPDGRTITFAIEVRTDLLQLIDALELIQASWRSVGVDMQIRPFDSSAMGERLSANVFDARAFGGTEGTNMLVLDPFYFLPFRTAGNIHFAVLWANWYNGATPSEEPPARVREQLALYDALKAEPDPQRQRDLMAQILEITAEEFYTIGVSLPPVGYGIVRTNLHNVPDELLSSWLYLTPGPINPAQFYFDATDQAAR